MLPKEELYRAVSFFDACIGIHLPCKLARSNLSFTVAIFTTYDQSEFLQLPTWQ